MVKYLIIHENFNVCTLVISFHKHIPALFIESSDGAEEEAKKDVYW